MTCQKIHVQFFYSARIYKAFTKEQTLIDFRSTALNKADKLYSEVHISKKE